MRLSAAIALSLSTALLAACGGGDGGDDAKVARVCKVLTEIAAKAKAENRQGEMVQMDVVFGLAAEFDKDMEYLGKFAADADTLTEKACPQARTDIIARSGKSSLGAVVR